MGVALLQGLAELGRYGLADHEGGSSPTVSDRSEEMPDGLRIEELQGCEAAARQEADELRSERARLTERPARAGERLSRLRLRRRRDP